MQRKVVCNAEGLKAFVKNASQQAAVLAASTLIAGVSSYIMNSLLVYGCRFLINPQRRHGPRRYDLAIRCGGV